VKLCWLGIHAWSRWRHFLTENLISRETGNRIGEYVFDVRECKYCGKRDVRKVLGT
jgi:hypothetical protein